jgi:superfamily II DNA or RNA helicase
VVSVSNFSWQEAALERFKSAGYRGIIEAATGTGKTRVGIEAIKLLKTKTLILVPTIVLMKQWKQMLVDEGANPDFIGFYYGNEKEFKEITIAVMNSVWGKKFDDEFNFLVADEVHRYGSELNRNFLVYNSFQFYLGLTATLNRVDGMEEELLRIFKRKVFVYDSKEAIKDGTLCDFDLVNVPCLLSDKEKEQYTEIERELKKHFSIYNYDFFSVKERLFEQDAQQVMKQLAARKEIVQNSYGKIPIVLNLIKQHKSEKIIVFNERIEMAEMIKEELGKENIFVSIYHSTKSKNDVERFRTGETKVLISVKALDEGLNVPDASIGIIVSGNSTRKQIVQRLGRILRAKEGKAKLYQLYFVGTIDEKYMRKRIEFLKN